MGVVGSFACMYLDVAFPRLVTDNWLWMGSVQVLKKKKKKREARDPPEKKNWYLVLSRWSSRQQNFTTRHSAANFRITFGWNCYSWQLFFRAWLVWLEDWVGSMITVNRKRQNLVLTFVYFKREIVMDSHG